MTLNRVAGAKWTGRARGKALLALLLGVLATASPAAAQTTIVNFDDGVDGNLVASHYSSLPSILSFTSNVRWVNLGNSEPGAESNEGNAPGSPHLGITLASADHPYRPADGEMAGVFQGVAPTFLSIRALNVGVNGARLRVYDAQSGGNLLGIADFVGTGDGMSGSTDEGVRWKTLFVDAGGIEIRRFELGQINNMANPTDGVAFDHLTYGTVPEPGASWLFIAAVVGVFAGKLRRRPVT